MFGFLVGGVSLAALLCVLSGRHRRCGAFQRGVGPDGPPWGKRGGPPQRWMLRKLFRKLETTPGQEQIITEEAQAIRDAMGRFRGKWARMSGAAAHAFGDEAFDKAPLDAAISDHQAQAQRAFEQLSDSLSTIHDSLVPEQRSKLANVLRTFRGRGPRGGPYRDNSGADDSPFDGSALEGES